MTKLSLSDSVSSLNLINYPDDNAAAAAAADDDDEDEEEDGMQTLVEATETDSHEAIGLDCHHLCRRSIGKSTRTRLVIQL